MINSVTPWTATVQEDINGGELLFETVLSQYKLQLYNTGDSIWLTSAWPDGGSIAFRLAFGINSHFEQVSVSDLGSSILITSSTRLGDYRINVSFPESQSAIFRYTTTFQAAFPILIPFWPRDIVPLTKDGKVENTAGSIHTHQVGTRSGQLFFSMTKPKIGSVFYFQNLSAMSAYCDATETSLSETVGGQWPEIGFRFPVNSEKPLPADKEFIISDAFVLLDEQIPEEDCTITSQYLNHLSAIYMLIPKPEPVYQDWQPIADTVLNDLHISKGCWTQTKGIPFLNAYVGDYDTPTEIMVQLAVLLPLQEYLEWTGIKHPVFDDLNNGLEAFYDDRINSIVRWHPALIHELDESEEQKCDMVMDSWYLHHPLLNLSRLALKGNKKAEKLFLNSIDYVIKVAHHFNYEWPVFYKMTTLEVLKAETSPGKGGEKDVPGSYAHIMLMAYKLTKQKRFVKEAVKALKSLEGLAFDIFYQANNTAFAATALVELYKETNDKKYLDLSYCCLAGIFKNTQIWDCNYGHMKNFPNFFSVFPLNDAPYTAAYEEFEVYAALHHYLLVAEDIDILPSLKILIPEFIKYAVSRLPFYYPNLLPLEMIAEDTKTGEVQKDLWIPLEDMHDGWEKSGQVGQEVYGAGLPFGIIPRQYFKLKSLDAIAFIDYPVTSFRLGKKSATFHIDGNIELKARLILFGLSKAVQSKIKVEVKNKSAYNPIKTKSSNQFEFPAGTMVRITWSTL
ncbi:MAG: hypothetical protein V4572_02430 [Bacteroidota bacterium]